MGGTPSQVQTLRFDQGPPFPLWIIPQGYALVWNTNFSAFFMSIALWFQLAGK